jgi:hypothetical protein
MLVIQRMTQGCPRAAFFCSTQAWIVFACLSLSGSLLAQNNSSLPNPRLTPGAIDPSVTPHNLQTTVCDKGYTATVRPDKRLTNQLKREQMRLYGYANANPQHYEEDHLIPLNIGGNPSDAHNLWPQPRYGAWSADQKNDLEFVAYKLVCSGQLDLKEAQQRIAHNWIEAYQAWVPSHPHLLPKGRRGSD